jgi:hypothetical protein
MIQRIQTVFLLVAIALISCMFFAPLANFTDTHGRVYEMVYNRFYSVGNSPEKYSEKLNMFIYLIMAIIGVLVFTLLSYKKRIIQIRLCTVSILLMVFLEIVVIFYFYQIKNTIGGTSAPGWGLIFPVASAAFTYLAMRAISKDEALVRSLDRLR